MAQAYATTFNFNGNEYQILVADRQQAHPVFYSRFWRNEEVSREDVCNIMGEGGFFYAGSPVSLAYLGDAARNHSDLETAYMDYHRGFNIEPSVVSIGDKVRSFRIDKGNIIKGSGIVQYAEEPSQISRIDIGHLENPKGKIIENNVLLEGKYDPTPDIAAKFLREMVAFDGQENRRISEYVDIAVSGPGFSGVMDYYRQNLHDLNNAKLYHAGVWLDVNDNDLELSNLLYRLSLPGLQDIVMEFTKYLPARWFFSHGWDKDPIRTELCYRGQAERLLYSKKQIMERLELTQKVLESIG